MAPALLALAMVVGIVVLLWLNRGSSLFFDEAFWFSDMGARDGMLSIFHPHNDHLIGTARSFYLLLANTIGVEYVAVRIAAVVGVLLVSGLFYVYARRRVGDWVALLPAILLIFYGSAWQHIVSPIGLTITYSIAAGLGALLALERDDRKGDVLATVLACASIFTYTIGLSYLVGIAVSVLLGADRVRRSWIFLIPLLLYVPWWLWARQFSDGRVSFGLLIDAPIYVAKSLANVAGALSGMAIPFSRFGDATAGIASAPGGPLGVIVGMLLIALVAWRIWRGSVPIALWASLAILATYWLMSAVADKTQFGTQVNAIRYILPGSVAALLVLVNVAKGYEIRPRLVWALTGLFAFSFAMNLAFLSDGASYVRHVGGIAKANLSMLEVSGGLNPGLAAGEGGTVRSVPPPERMLQSVAFQFDPENYLSAVEKFGSPGPTIEELQDLDLQTRMAADRSLITYQGIEIEPDGEAPAPRQSCLKSNPDSELIPVPEGGAAIRANGGEAVTVSLRRFSDDPGVSVGQAEPAAWSTLAVPEDHLDQPWMVAAPSTGEIRICQRP